VTLSFDPASSQAPAGAASAPALPAPTPVRVAWVAGPRTLEEYGRILQPLAVGLLDELVELTAICPQAAGVERLPSPPVRILRYGRLNWWALWEAASTMRELAGQVESGRVQLLHALDSSAAPLAARLSRETKTPYVLSSYDLRDGRRVRRLPVAPACVLAASEILLKELRQRAGGGTRLELLRPGVYPVRRASCFTQPQYRVTLVAGGRLEEAAAGKAALRAFASVAQRKYDCAYFILGAARAERDLRAMARKLGLYGDLAFADWQEHWQLEEIFKAANLYAAPAEQKDLDVRCLLAMAAGVPVLAAGQGACDFLIEGRTATLFRRGDARDLAEGLLRFLEDRAAARAQADSALEYLREHHTPARMVAELARVYRLLAGAAAGTTA
jgi:glycosyltransferase involved in cell wall biosynthesis